MADSLPQRDGQYSCIHMKGKTGTGLTMQQTKDFIKFLSLVFILYFGFLTTFTRLARDHFTPREMVCTLGHKASFIIDIHNVELDTD